MTRPQENRKRDSNLGSSALEADALTTRPTRRSAGRRGKGGGGQERSDEPHQAFHYSRRIFTPAMAEYGVSIFNTGRQIAKYLDGRVWGIHLQHHYTKLRNTWMAERGVFTFNTVPNCEIPGWQSVGYSFSTLYQIAKYLAGRVWDVHFQDCEPNCEIPGWQSVGYSLSTLYQIAKHLDGRVWGMHFQHYTKLQNTWMAECGVFIFNTVNQIAKHLDGRVWDVHFQHCEPN